MDFKKYGYSKNNTDYWLLTSQAIWNDPSLTIDDKMDSQEELVKQYQSQKREKKTTIKDDKTHLFANIRNAIGYSQSESDSRVKKELIRLKDKSAATWSAIERKCGLSKKEILKEFNIQ